MFYIQIFFSSITEKKQSEKEPVGQGVNEMEKRENFFPKKKDFEEKRLENRIIIVVVFFFV